MTRDELRTRVLRALSEVAPEADPSSLSDGLPLREQLDIDSVDLLRFAIALHNEFSVDVPEADYPKLGTIGGCVEYFESHAPAGSAAAGAPA